MPSSIMLWNPSTARRWLVRAVVVGTFMVAGCAGFVPQSGPDPEPPGRYVDLTRPIIAVGDTQEHESTGFPLHDNDSAIDSFVEVAQRPPEQPLFGRRMLEWALQRHPDDPWLHLGDVMDMSCRSEAQRMSKIFLGAGRSGAVLPGNHDGLMFGIYNHNILDAVLDPGARKWNLACQRAVAAGTAARPDADGAMSKRDFIAMYLAGQAYGQHAEGGLKPPSIGKAERISWRNPDAQALLSGIEVNLLEGYRYADSYLAQRLRLPRSAGATRDVILIGLDTNQAGALVSTWDTLRGRSPGSVGHVHPDQVQAVTKWVLEAARNGDIVVFAGHHNWQSLGLPTRLLLRNLMSNLSHPLVYLSAHTHRGFWAVHRGLDARPLLELNVSSLSDWPIAYRRISFAYDEQANRLLVRGDLMPRGEQPSAADTDLLAAWSAQTCERSGFSIGYLRSIDLGLVRQQRESRGSLLNWVREALSAECLPCELSRYEHAQAYQNEMLTTLVEVGLHLGPDAAGLAGLALPPFCDGSQYVACANSLIGEKPRELGQHVALFRRKAQLVALLGDHLDDLQEPRARAYMTCRAVLGAKTDFDATDDDRNSDRGEHKRRAEQFFRIEASVGME
jgi:hypothetical protein